MWAWQREFSVILDRFLTFYPPNNLKNQNFQKLKINSRTFYHFTLVYYKWQSYDVWFLRYRARQTGFFVMLDHFLPFYSPNNPKNQNFWKMKNKKNPLEILSFNASVPKIMIICYTVPEIWLFWAIFFPFTPLTVWKMKISKKWIKLLEILSFYTSVPKIITLWYSVNETWRVTDVIVIFHFGLFLPFYLPKKWKFQKNEKVPGDIIILHKCTKNYD